MTEFAEHNPLATGSKFMRNKVLCSTFLGGDKSFLCPERTGTGKSTEQHALTACVMLVLLALVSTVALTYTGNLIKYSKKKAVAKAGPKDKGPYGLIVGGSITGLVVVAALMMYFLMRARSDLVTDINYVLAYGLAIAATAGVATHTFVNADGNTAALGAGIVGIVGSLVGMGVGHLTGLRGRTENVLVGGIVGGTLAAAVGASFGVGWNDDVEDPDKSAQLMAFGATWNKVFGAKHVTYYLIAMLAVMALAQGIAIGAHMMGVRPFRTGPQAGKYFNDNAYARKGGMLDFPKILTSEEFSELSSLSSIGRNRNKLDLSSIGSF